LVIGTLIPDPDPYLKCRIRIETKADPQNCRAVRKELAEVINSSNLARGDKVLPVAGMVQSEFTVSPKQI
jgi:hypothetical protein